MNREAREPFESVGESSPLPRRIWMLWFQGWEQAPALVQRCQESWARHNPGWEMNLLTESTIHEYTDLDLTDYRGVGSAELSDILRLKLLSEHGGVWADATCLCTRPLDAWLYPWLASGFFAFSRPAPDRLLSTWFLAALPGNQLVLSWYQILSSFLAGPAFVNPKIARPLRVGHLVLDNHVITTRVWLIPFLRNWLRIYPPTYVAHYLFTDLIRKEAQARRIWDRTPRFSANIPHRISRHVLLRPLTAPLRAEIESGMSPIYKLTWKGLPPTPPSGSVLDYLVAAHGSSSTRAQPAGT